MNIRSLFDNKQNTINDDEKKNSFFGGEKGGVSVQHSAHGSSESSNNVYLTCPPPGARKITLYKNGFCVDGGEFRPLSNPENAKFIASVQSGYAPKELQASSCGPVSLILEDLRKVDHEPPEQPKPLYSGEGRSTNAMQQVTPSVEVDTSRSAVKIDPSKPITVIKFRFYDGTTVRQQFNETHTVQDLHNYVFEAAPIDNGYQLLCGYPPSCITSNLRLSLKEAGLLNVTMIQRSS